MLSNHLVPQTVSFQRRRPAGVRHRSVALDRLLEDVWNANHVTPSGDALSPVDFVPRVDIDESATEVRLSAELPGIDANDVEVKLDADVISISGERKVEREEGREGQYRVETARGAFRRSIRLPFEAAGDNEITFADGAKFYKNIDSTAAGAVIVPRNIKIEAINTVQVDNPRVAFAKLMDIFHKLGSTSLFNLLVFVDMEITPSPINLFGDRKGIS